MIKYFFFEMKKLNMKQISGFIFRILDKDWRYRIFNNTNYFSYKKEKTSGIMLEFIGTSGVGKSTLFRNCMYELRKRWFFSYHIDSMNRKYPLCGEDEILNRILKTRIDKIYNSDSFCPWHSLLDLQLSVKVMHRTMLAAHSTHPKGFAFDEGLFRHFPAEILQFGSEFPVRLWENRAFVYLQARTPETALSRLKSRRMIVSQKQLQRVRTDEELLSGIVQDQENFQSIVDRAVSFGCPVLVIDAENPLQNSIKKVIDFERSLSQRCRTRTKTQAMPQFNEK